MPHKVSGSRTLKKGSKKNSKSNSKSKSHKTSKRHNGMDFTAILNDMSGVKSSMANMMGPSNMQMDPNMMMQQGQMQNQMMDPNMMMQQGMHPGMQEQMMDPNMMMGKQSQSNEQELDPLNLQYIVPQHKNLNLNNYGISYDQLLRGSQHNGLSDKFNGMQNNMQSVQQKMDSLSLQ